MEETMDIERAAVALNLEMAELGYKTSARDRLVGQVRILAGFCESGLYSEEAGEAYCSCGNVDGTPFSEQHLRTRRRVVRLVEGFLADGTFDLRPANPNVPLMPQGADALGALCRFREYSAERGLKESTCKNYLDMAREFAVWLEGEGAAGLEAATPSHALGFLSYMMERRPNTDAFYIKASLRPFLGFLGREDMVECLRLASSTKSRKIIEVLDDDVEEGLVSACCDAGRTKPRDAAMTLIALTTGLRAGDILDIRLGDVDWDKSRLSVRQNKTGASVVLPLRPATRNALARYVLEDRPEPAIGGDDHVFLRARAPHRPLSSAATVYQATERVLASVGARGGGTRLFRRNAATKMLRSGAPSPVISAVLGHARPATTDVYMEVDGPRMRECVLPLPEGVRSWL